MLKLPSGFYLQFVQAFDRFYEQDFCGGETKIRSFFFLFFFAKGDVGPDAVIHANNYMLKHISVKEYTIKVLTFLVCTYTMRGT